MKFLSIMAVLILFAVYPYVMTGCTINRNYYVTIYQEAEGTVVDIDVEADVTRDYDSDLGFEIPLL